MADNVQWIKMKVGMFDGESFKKIKRARIGGVPFRDKLTAVWFELLDLAGKSNSNGCLVDSNEIPYRTYEDIAVMIDRDETEVELCMQFFISQNMVEIIDDIFCLTNFVQYQNQHGLDQIREKKRIAQAKWRERSKKGLVGTPRVENVDIYKQSTSNLPSNSISYSNSISNNMNTPVYDNKQTNTQTEKKSYKEKLTDDEKSKYALFCYEVIKHFSDNRYESNPLDFIRYNEERDWRGGYGEDVKEHLATFALKWEMAFVEHRYEKEKIEI
jgi:predicted phage replisome organizer